jgi:hypothetical protein
MRNAHCSILALVLLAAPLTATAAPVGSDWIGSAGSRPESGTKCSAVTDAKWIVLFDDTDLPAPGATDADVNVPANSPARVFSFAPPSDSTSTACKLLGALAPNTAASRDGGKAIAILRDTGVADALAGANVSRWTSEKGDHLDVYVCHDANLTAPVIGFAETKRATRLSTDFDNLVTVATTIHNQAVRVKTYACELKRYELQQDRANLAVSIAKLQAAAGAPKTSATSQDSLVANLTTGPIELFFLTANVGFTSAQQATYDPAAKALGPAKTPSAFSISFNVAFGDLNQDVPTSCGWSCEWAHAFHGTYVGLFAEASSTPLSQIGGIVGFSWIPYLRRYISTQVASPFAGIVWAKTDSVANVATGKVTTHYGLPQAIFGISVNLTKAVAWLTPSTGSGSAKPATTSSSKSGS